MQAPLEFGFQQLATELLRSLADAVADRPGETEAQRFARHQTAIFSTMAFLPRDALETMVAGQCVMFDHLLRDAVRDLLRNDADPSKRRIRSQVTALGRLFLKNLDQFRQLRARPEQQPAASPPDPAKFDGTQPAEAVTTDVAALDAPASAASQPQAGKADLLRQHGFQNRRMRRASQFKKPGSKAPSSQSAQTTATASGSGPAEGR
jgi:hypothetical protein